jgi:hypothetical protein
VFHNAVEWDWLIPGLTIPAMWCGFVLLQGVHDSATIAIRGRLTWAFAAVFTFLLVVSTAGFVGNDALSRSYGAANRGDYSTAAADARYAAEWQPWSYLPWLEVGSAERALGHTSAALSAYRTAVQRGPGSWQTWVALSSIAGGEERVRALDRATELDPRGRQIAKLCSGSPLPGCVLARHLRAASASS